MDRPSAVPTGEAGKPIVQLSNMLGPNIARTGQFDGEPLEVSIRIPHFTASTGIWLFLYNQNGKQ